MLEELDAMQRLKKVNHAVRQQIEYFQVTKKVFEEVQVCLAVVLNELSIRSQLMTVSFHWYIVAAFTPASLLPCARTTSKTVAAGTSCSSKCKPFARS